MMLNGAVPGFEITGGLPLVAARGLFDAALFSTFGTLLFWTRVLPLALARTPPEAQAALDRRLLAVVRVSLIVACLSGLGWLAIQSGLMADADGAAQALRAVPSVLASTRFGHLLVLQAAALAAAASALGSGGRADRRTLSLSLATGALLLQAGHGHAMSMQDGPSLLLLSAAVHLLAGGAWLGGLLPLLLTVRITPPRAGATASRSFSVLGKWCVGLMAVSAALQAWILVGSIPALVGTAYGWTACIKLLIFGVLLGFACLNRYRLAPALMGQAPEPARRRLVASIGVQSGFGLAVLLTAGVLSSLPPGMHSQAIWPFSRQFSLTTVREDAGFLREVQVAGLAIAGAVVLAGLGLVLRRWRRAAALAVAALICVLAVPHLDLLLVEATPTSFFHSPTEFSAASIVRGDALYPGHCAACHGAGGHGDGPLASGLPVPPADLTAGHLWMHADGEMFWWLTHGIEAPLGGMAMPGFAKALTPDDRWALIDFIRARNAGLARRSSGAWPMQVQAPSFQAACADGRETTLADLRGRIVRLVIGRAIALPEAGVVTVEATADPAARPDAGRCIVDDQTILAAYSVVAGIGARDLPGVQFLIDADGRLRAALPATGQPDRDMLRLRADIGDIRQHALPAPPVMDHMQM